MIKRYLSATSRRLVIAGIILVALLFGWFVWPTPHRYDQIGWGQSSFPVRIDRLTGDAEWLMPSKGWIPFEPDEEVLRQEAKEISAIIYLTY